MSPLLKTELKWSGLTHVPVALLGEEVLADSSLIVSRVAAEAEAARRAQQPPQRAGWFGHAPPAPPQPSAASLGAALDLTFIIKLSLQP